MSLSRQIVTAPPAAAPEARHTPMMAQYIEIKANNPGSLLFYRMGDFYELFFEDAEIASRALGIVLTKRGKHEGADIRMCGVPVERADDYLQRLIGLGHRVAVCEQMEDPAEARKRGPKSVVARAVVRLVTPGTITEERLLEPARAANLVALARLRVSDEAFTYGLACVDISTGAFTVCETDAASLAAEIARLEPREIIVPDAAADDPRLKNILADSRAAVTPVARDMADAGLARERLLAFFGVATLDGFGAFTKSEIAACALAVAYIERTQLSARPLLAAPARAAPGGTIEIDAATRANLELTRTLGGERAGSLLADIDRTVTPAGGRLLAERLGGPLTDPAAIARRHDALAFFIDGPGAREKTRAALKAAPDFARALSRLALQRGGPRDLQALRDGLAAIRALHGVLATAPELSAELSEALACAMRVDAGVEPRLAAALAEELPLNRRDGGFVRRGFSPALDEARRLLQNAGASSEPSEGCATPSWSWSTARPACRASGRPRWPSARRPRSPALPPDLRRARRRGTTGRSFARRCRRQ